MTDQVLCIFQNASADIVYDKRGLGNSALFCQTFSGRALPVFID